MISDLAKTPPGELPVFDVCVAGGGVAGLTVALKLASLGRRVVVLEAGDRTRSAASQAFYRGENTGVENLLLHETRLRMLGGSSNHWGGWCKPFAPYDLARTDLTAGASWPISTKDLEPYLDEAGGILGITEFSGEDLPLTGSDGNLQSIRMFFSAPPAALGERFVDAITNAPNLLLFMNASAVDLQMAAANRVAAMTVRSAGSSNGFICRARQFVLALGTVENVRMLSWWNQKNGNRIANPALLGRYYMQHLHQTLGEFVLFDAAQTPAPAGARPTTYITSTERLLRQTGLGAFRLYSSAIACERLKDQLTGASSATLCSSVTAGGSLAITCEQAPNPDSRISLLAATDELGIPRVRMAWVINDADKRTLREAALEFGRYLVRARAGRLKIAQPILDQTTPLAGWTRLASAPGAAGHQLGGARMSATPEDGVTDPDCRLWGIDNFYVGGAAVFRTSGHVNPTLTLTQLALRLAATLDRRLAA